MGVDIQDIQAMVAIHLTVVTLEEACTEACMGEEDMGAMDLMDSLAVSLKTGER